MSVATLEHVNMTVSDPEATARMLEDIFGWKTRWKGPSLGGGFTVHVGTDDHYVGLYRPAPGTEMMGADKSRSTKMVGGLNHVAVTVDDLDATEGKILAAGFKTLNHADYEPGRRFYFFDHDGIEYEVVSYA